MAPALSRCSYRARWPASSLLGSGWRPPTGSAQMPCSHLPGEQMPLHLERRGEGRLLAAGEVGGFRSAGRGHLVPKPAVQVDVVASGLAGRGVADVGVERMAVVGDLGP